MSERLYTITHKKTGQVIALIEASSTSQAYGRLCQADYQISVTRAIDVGPHIRNGGRVITGIMEDFYNALGGEHNVAQAREPNRNAEAPELS